MVRSILFPVVLLISLTACSGTPGWVWYQSGADEMKLAGDVDDCLSETEPVAVSPVIHHEIAREYYEEKERLYRDCMRLRGWEIIDADKVEVPWEEEKQRYPTDFDLGLKY